MNVCMIVSSFFFSTVASTLAQQDNQVSLDTWGCQSISCLNAQLENVNKRLEDKDNSISAFQNGLDALKMENDELRMKIQRLENLVFANNLDGSTPKNIKTNLKVENDELRMRIQ